MNTYRIAIIGTGASINNHVEAIRAVGDRVQVVAAVDVDEARVKAFADKFTVPRYFTDAADMLAAVKPDLVHIVTPPATHMPLAIQCLEAGAWVYCEKPLCRSLAEFDQITQAEQRTGRYLSTVFQWRFGSAAQHLKRLIAANQLGRFLVGNCHTLWYRNAAYYQVPWRGKWSTESGGPTTTLGIHLMDLFLWLVDEWAEVTAITGTLDRQIEVEDVSMALVRFQDGSLGNIVNSALSPRQESHLRLDFQQATVEVNTLYRYTNVNWRCTPLDSEGEASGALASWRGLDQDVMGSHGVQLAQILDSMDRGERPPVSGLEGRRIIEFIASLYKSALTGRSVQRGSIGSDDPFYHAMNGEPYSVTSPNAANNTTR
ncbi:MAG: Gfo/Idh/MocA family oxidoreductase [Anaerolineae bacterium]|nr:Gfo/Idh/MocA family oxidoreductase [Anaerolineae bacterium]